MIQIYCNNDTPRKAMTVTPQHKYTFNPIHKGVHYENYTNITSQFVKVLDPDCRLIPGENIVYCNKIKAVVTAKHTVHQNPGDKHNLTQEDQFCLSEDVVKTK